MHLLKSYKLILLCLIITSILHAQEGEGPKTPHVDKVYRVDTTKSYFIDVTTQNIGTEKNWDPQFTKFIDVIDKSTGKRITRIDVIAKLKEAGFKTINYNNHTRSLFYDVAANDRFVAFSAKDGGFIGVDIHSQAIIYNHEKKSDDLWPFWSNEDYFIALFIEKNEGDEINSRTSYAIFNSDFKMVAKINYNIELGKKKILKGGIIHFDRSDFTKLHSVNTIEINTNLLSSMASIKAGDYKVERGDIDIGNGLIKAHDEGVMTNRLKPYYTREFSVAQGVWKLEHDSLPDGSYWVRRSNYFPEMTQLELSNGGIATYTLPNSKPNLLPLPASEQVRFNVSGLEIKDDIYFSKFTGNMINGKINDGEYEVSRSDYWEVGKVFSILDKKIDVKPPVLKVKETATQLTFKYQGFNYSYGGDKGLDLYGLEINFYK